MLIILRKDFILHHARQNSAFHPDLSLESEKEPEKRLWTQRCEAIILQKWQSLDDASIILRKQASALLSTTNVILWYPIWRLPPRSDIMNAYGIVGPNVRFSLIFSAMWRKLDWARTAYI